MPPLFPISLLIICFPTYTPIPLFFFNDTATTEIYTLSLHDALPIYASRLCKRHPRDGAVKLPFLRVLSFAEVVPWNWRSEEHTSELQSHLNLVCRLLLEKKKNTAVRVLPQAFRVAGADGGGVPYRAY